MEKLTKSIHGVLKLESLGGVLLSMHKITIKAKAMLKQCLSNQNQNHIEKIQRLKPLTQASIFPSSFGIVAWHFSADTERRISRPEP